MAKTIKFSFSESSIDAAIKQLREYRESLNEKIQRFVDALIQEGVTVAMLRVSSTQGDSKLPDVQFEVNPMGDIVKATISIVGPDVLFVEFGAGIAYNTGKEHPKASEFGYGVGTYPSKNPPNKAINPGYWYYSDADNAGNNVSKRSIGTEASMPIYGAAETIRNQAIIRATEIFRS